MFTGVQFTHFIQANPALAVFLTVAIGFWIGKFRFGNFSLGIVTSVLLVGVVVGQMNIRIPEPARAVFQAAPSADSFVNIPKDDSASLN